jgi:hypothetical protein
VPLSKNASRAMQRQVDLTTAVCQERLLATHVRHVLGMVDLVADQLPFDDALDIYVRIIRLTPEQARNIGSRALAELARREGLPEPEQLRFEAPDPPEHDEPEHQEKPEKPEKHDEGRTGAIFGRLRQRIRGRVHEELRTRINLAAARTEDDLLQTHVENALIFAKALSEESSVFDSVELYLETMMIPEGIADVIYNRALRTLAEDILPPVAPASNAGLTRADRETLAESAR